MFDTISLKVAEVVRETADAATIRLKQPMFRKVRYKAGQFLTLILQLDGKKVQRAYSMSSAPGLDATIDITVKRVQGGKVSNYLLDHLKAGDHLEVADPMGTFVFEPDGAKARHLMLWAAGSGITPLFSILRLALQEEPGSRITLVYANRTPQEMIFGQRLQQLQQQYPDRLRLLPIYSKPAADWGGFSGRIDTTMAANIYNLMPQELPILHYVCGPEGMMQAVQEGLKLMRVPASAIYSESFVPKADAATDSRTHTVEVIVDGEHHRFEVSPKQTVLEAGLDQGIDLPYSCQSGVCTACRGKRLSGQVQSHDDRALSQQEMDEGYLLTCQCHPLSDDVVIEIG